MELVRMKLADLRANPMNVRTSFAGLDELADRLELTPGRPGEPMYPIVAVRDANVARIVDGERRYRAMKRRRKVKECYVFLCDDMGEAEQAVAILAANDRENLSDANVSAGYQQALMLGVPESDIDRLAGREGAGKALKRAIERSGGKAVQLSLDQIAAADEFADSDEDYRAVMESDSWSWEASRIKRRRKEEGDRAELEAAITEVVEAHGLVVADAPPKGAGLVKTLYDFGAGMLREEGPTWAAAGRILVRPYRKGGEYGYMTAWQLFDPPIEMTEEEAAAQKSLNNWRRIRSAGEKRRAEWLGARLAQGGGRIPGRLVQVEMLVAQYYQDHDWYYVSDFLKKAGVDDEEWPVSANAWMLAARWTNIDHLTNDECDAIADSSKSCSIKDPWKQHIEVMHAMKASGYEPDEDEAAFLKLCEKRAAEAKKAGKGGR